MYWMEDLTDSVIEPQNLGGRKVRVEFRGLLSQNFPSSSDLLHNCFDKRLVQAKKS